MTEEEFPEGWIDCLLGEVLTLSYGKPLPDRDRSGSGFPVYGSNGIVGYHETPLTSGPTIIVGRKGSAGEVTFSDGPCSPIDTTYYVDNVQGMPTKFWYYQLKNLPLGSLNKATAVPGLNREDAYRLPLGLPPTAEQRRIVDKLDGLLARVDACREPLARVPGVLKRFRQSVLAAATSGALTGEWRKTNPATENASELVFRIRAKRESLSRRSITESTIVTEDESSELPESWKWATPVDLAADERYSLAIGPFGSNLKVADYRKSGVPLVFVRNIRSENFDLTNATFVEVEKARELAAHQADPGDILITKMGEPPGDACLYPLSSPSAVITADCIKWKVAPDFAETMYFVYAINSDVVKQQIIDRTRGVAQAKISLERFRTLAIPVPPLAEMAEITRRVERLFAYADRLESRCRTARAAVDRLTPALLAKAFRGELVAQDAVDEPAGVLLVRVRAERVGAGKKNARLSIGSAH